MRASKTSRMRSRNRSSQLADYRVNLDIFAGPLDLLLYLVRKEEVDIYDIPLAKITDQYLQYLELLKQLDIDLAGDFLVMAATLMEIKSAMLLPRADPEQAGEAEAGRPAGRADPPAPRIQEIQGRRESARRRRRAAPGAAGPAHQPHRQARPRRRA